MAYNTRVCPKSMTSITLVSPARAPRVMIWDAVVRPRSMKARAIGASMLMSRQGTIPVRTADTRMYNTVQTSSEVMIPIGRSRCGFFASCAVVETASNPMYAKKMYAAPAPMPDKPYGAKLDQLMPQFPLLTYAKPRAITNSTTETLITTIVALKRALSLIPIAKMVVMTIAIMKAGTLMPISCPKRIGAASRS